MHTNGFVLSMILTAKPFIADLCFEQIDDCLIKYSIFKSSSFLKIMLENKIKNFLNKILIKLNLKIVSHNTEVCNFGKDLDPISTVLGRTKPSDNEFRFEFRSNQ